MTTETTWTGERLARWRQARDADALGELLKWQRDRAYATACRILGNAADAEDAVQQAFLKLLTRTHGFEDQRAFRSAVYRAVVQCALDMIRARRTRDQLEQAMTKQRLPDAMGPKESAERAEALGAIDLELSRLPESDRAAVVLCCQEGLSITEAADALSVRRETLRDRLRRVLVQVRANLKSRGLALSAVGVMSMLQEGAARAAPNALCRALDGALPGGACAQIPAMAAAPALSAGLLATAGVAGAQLKLGAAAALLVAAGTAALVLETTRDSIEKPSQRIKPVSQSIDPPAVLAAVEDPEKEQAMKSVKTCILHGFRNKKRRMV